jgi:hypothetical protein
MVNLNNPTVNVIRYYHSCQKWTLIKLRIEVWTCFNNGCNKIRNGFGLKTIDNNLISNRHLGVLRLSHSSGSTDNDFVRKAAPHVFSASVFIASLIKNAVDRVVQETLTRNMGLAMDSISL